MSNIHRGFIVVALPVIACEPPPVIESSVAQQLSIGTIDAVVIDGPGPCPITTLIYNDHGQLATNCRYFTLWNGSAGFPADCIGDTRVYPTAMCSNGKIYSGEFLGGGLPQAGISYCSAGQINVAITGDGDDGQNGHDYWPAGTACSFVLDYRPTFPTKFGPAPAFSNTFGPVGRNMVTAIHDEGVVNGTQVLRLDGVFPDPMFDVIMSCNSAAVGATIMSATSSEVRVNVVGSVAASPNSCEVQVADKLHGLFSNPIAIRLGGAPPSLPVNIGAYYWGSYLAPDQPSAQAMPAAAAQLKAAGFGSVLRIPIGPRDRLAGLDLFYMDSNLIQSTCPITGEYLPCAVHLPPYQAAFATLPVATPERPVYAILTAYDSAAMGEYGYDAAFLNPDAMKNPDKREAIISEYKNLTLAIYETQQGTGRRFIISNWEENANYSDCTGFHGGHVDLNTNCLEVGTTEHQSASCAFTQYLLLRKTGISRGIAAATAAGYASGSNPPSVAMGVEFAHYFVTNSQLACAVPSVAAAILTPSVPQYTLYSTWQSANAGTMDEDLAGVKNFLQANTPWPPTPLIIGELGAEDTGGIGKGAWAFAENVKAAYRAGLPAINVWHAAGSRVWPAGTGVLNPDGSDTASMTILRSALAGYTATLPTAVQINGAHDVGIDETWWTSPVTGPRRWFELYGSFPTTGGSYTVITRCHWLGSSDLAATTTQVCTQTSTPCYLNFASSGQINVGFVTQPATKVNWCTFQVVTTAGVSPEFGARSACALPRCTTTMDCTAKAPGSICNTTAQRCAYLGAPLTQASNATPECLCDNDGTCNPP